MGGARGVTGGLVAEEGLVASLEVALLPFWPMQMQILIGSEICKLVEPFVLVVWIRTGARRVIR